MRILLLNHEYPPLGGGSGVAMRHLAEALAMLGHDVHVLTGGRADETTTQNGITLQRLALPVESGKLAGMKAWLSYLWHMPSHLKTAVTSFRPDVVNSHFVFPSGYVVAQSSLDVPHVTSVVGADIHDPTRTLSADSNFLIRQFTRSAISNAFAITTPSTDLTQRTRALFPQTNVQTIPWGVPPLPFIHPVGEPENSRRFVITTLCRLVPRKRLDLLIEAVALLKQSDIHVVVLGDGPQREELTNLVEQHQLSTQFTFRGSVNEQQKASELSASDLFCLPSDHEGFGLVYLEAMGLRNAVIATDVGGQRDIIREGIDGFLVPRNDAPAIARHIQSLMNDRPRLESMKQSAQARADEFRPAATAQQFLRVYQQAVESK